MQGPADPFPKQNEGDPKKKYRTHQDCDYQQDSEKFLGNVESHFNTHSTGLLMTGCDTERNCQKYQERQIPLRTRDNVKLRDT